MGTDIHAVWQKKSPSGRWEEIPSNWKQERHYNLFAVLADVRNGFGFAGILTGEAVKPISSPRGLPEDFEVDDYYTDAVNKHWMGDHSFSWLSGEEMLAYSLPSVIKTGIISRSAYDAWDKKKSPATWSADITGRHVITINDSLIEKQLFPNWTHIRVEWDGELKKELKYFFDEVARLVRLHKKIRLVFGFDS